MESSYEDDIDFQRELELELAQMSQLSDHQLLSSSENDIDDDIYGTDLSNNFSFSHTAHEQYIKAMETNVDNFLNVFDNEINYLNANLQKSKNFNIPKSPPKIINNYHDNIDIDITNIIPQLENDSNIQRIIKEQNKIDEERRIIEEKLEKERKEKELFDQENLRKKEEREKRRMEMEEELIRLKEEEVEKQKIMVEKEKKKQLEIQMIEQQNIIQQEILKEKEKEIKEYEKKLIAQMNQKREYNQMSNEDNRSWNIYQKYLDKKREEERLQEVKLMNDEDLRSKEVYNKHLLYQQFEFNQMLSEDHRAAFIEKIKQKERQKQLELEKMKLLQLEKQNHLLKLAEEKRQKEEEELIRKQIEEQNRKRQIEEAEQQRKKRIEWILLSQSSRRIQKWWRKLKYQYNVKNIQAFFRTCILVHNFIDQRYYSGTINLQTFFQMLFHVYQMKHLLSQKRKLERKSAIIIQKIFRGFFVRSNPFLKQRTIEYLQKRNTAAALIQKVYRGFKIRQKIKLAQKSSKIAWSENEFDLPDIDENFLVFEPLSNFEFNFQIEDIDVSETISPSSSPPPIPSSPLIPPQSPHYSSGHSSPSHSPRPLSESSLPEISLNEEPNSLAPIKYYTEDFENYPFLFTLDLPTNKDISINNIMKEWNLQDRTAAENIYLRQKKNAKMHNKNKLKKMDPMKFLKLQHQHYQQIETKRKEQNIQMSYPLPKKSKKLKNWLPLQHNEIKIDEDQLSTNNQDLPTPVVFDGHGRKRHMWSHGN